MKILNAIQRGAGEEGQLMFILYNVVAPSSVVDVKIPAKCYDATESYTAA